MAKGDLEGKTLPNKKLKCWMMKNAKNGAMYRTCATPEKKKAPKKQVRGAPRPANQRQDKYLVAYPNGRPKPAKKAKKPATKAPAKPATKPKDTPIRKKERAIELITKYKIAKFEKGAKPIINKAKKKIAENKGKKALEKAKVAVAKGGAKVSKTMPKKTHSMPDGTKMTGATHTANSKPVKKAPAKPKAPVKNPSKKITKADRKKYDEQLRADMKNVKNKEDYDMMKKKYDEIEKATTKAQVAMIKTKYAKN